MAGRRVLIIEDQHAIVLQNLLELYDGNFFEFEIVADGLQAVEKLAGPLPDLVLLDLRLPGLGGLVVLDAIRRVDSCLPVIVVSAYGDKRTRQEAKERGANDFFQKPVSAMKLHRRMRQLLALAPHPINTLNLQGREAELLAKHRRLWKLKERKALLGSNAPPELLIEIEDIEKEIHDDLTST